MIRTILLLSMLMVLPACSEFAILMSGASIAGTQNAYVKAYNSIDVLTIMSTEKSIKRHAYDGAKKALTGVKKGKEYIYDKTWGLTSN